MPKLNEDQKAFRKAWKADNPKALIVSFGAMTVVFVPTCRGNGFVSWSICSPDEDFRRKYGEFIAMNRMSEDICLPCKMPESVASAEWIVGVLEANLLV